MKRTQFSLKTLLILAMLAPPLIGGGMILSRRIEVPFWAIAGGAVLLVFWSAALIHVLRNGLPRKI